MPAALREASSGRRRLRSSALVFPPARAVHRDVTSATRRALLAAFALGALASGAIPQVHAQAAPESGDLDPVLRVALEAPAAAPAAVDQEIAVVPLRNGHLVAVGLTDGRIRWAVPRVTTTAPTAGDGLVFVAGDQQVTAHTRDGVLLWSRALPDAGSAPALWDTGWLIVPAGTAIVCYRARDGEVLWRHDDRAPISARPAIAADRVYASLEDGRVLALGLMTGTPIWEHRLGDAPGPVLALDDRLFVGSRDRFFYCLATSDGRRRWRWRTGGVITGAPVVDEERVYFASWDNALRGLNRGNGHLRWRTNLPLRPSGGPLRLGRLVYVAGLAADVRAYRAHTGVAAGRFTRPAELAAPPQLVPHAVPDLEGLLLLTLTGELYVLQRRIEPAIVPMTQVVGVEVPLEAPPVPTQPLR
jgi:outer membrane protein assembly factor BamB